MQKRPKTTSKYSYTYLPIKVPDDFPVFVSDIARQGDRPITYLHSHDHPELGLCLKGSGIFVVDSKVLRFSEGDAIFISPKEMHLAQSTPGTVSEWIWIYFNSEKLLLQTFKSHELSGTGRLSGENFSNIPDRKKFPLLQQYLGEFIRTCKEKKKFWKEKAASFLCLIIADFHNSMKKSKSQEAESRFSPDPDSMTRLQKAISYMTTHYRQKLSLRQLCKICGISNTHFKRLFSKVFKCSPIAFLNKIRIASACADLEYNSKPINTIALESGYDSLSSFNRQFKKLMDMPPREWRKCHKSQY